jgi:hypothetical protein
LNSQRCGKLAKSRQTNAQAEIMNTKFRLLRTAIQVSTCVLALHCLAGDPQKWETLPSAVRATVLANGGSSGQQVDKEGGTRNGMAIYEASVKDKNGDVADLVISADGKLAETKHDDAADLAQERAERARKLLKKLTFSHPLDITNPYLPLAFLKQDVLEGSEDGKKVRIERTAKPDMHRTFRIGGKNVEAFVVEDREWEDGQLAEVAIDYFAQADDGSVCYLGEDVDEYANGKLKGHEGSWALGRDTDVPGIIIPAHPKVGGQFQSEDVSKDISENDEVTSVAENVTVPLGTYQNCVKIKESLADGTVEHKFYAKGIGVVRELPSVGDVVLKSHTTQSDK